MNIAIVGSGNIGATMGRKWSATGHDVVFAVRDPDAEKVNYLLDSLPGTSVQHIGPAIRECAVVLLALPGKAVAEMVKANAEELNSKIIIDATNQVGRPVMHSMALLAQELPQARIYRAFNSLGWEVFADPCFGDECADHFYCGSSGTDRDVVSDLISDVGVRPVYIGGPEAATLLDSLTKLWFVLALEQGYGRHTGLRLLHD